jgi:hypothetical protein
MQRGVNATPIGADDDAVGQPLSVLLAAVFVTGNGVALLIVAYGAFYPDENPTRANQDTYVGAFYPVAVCFAAAFTVLGAVATSRRRLAVAALVLHVGLVGLVLAVALPLSAHSDGKLIELALAVEIIGASAVRLTWAAPPQTLTPSRVGEARLPLE